MNVLASWGTVIFEKTVGGGGRRLVWLRQNLSKNTFLELEKEEDINFQAPPPPKGPTPGSGEPPEGRTQEGAQKLKSNPPTVWSNAKGCIQGRRMRAQMWKTDAVDGVKKGRKAHRGTRASEQNKACILLLLRTAYHQKLWSKRWGVHITQTSTLIWKKFPIWENF